ncbi:hypothetical protein M2302_002093 [Micromonospora sp. A200]|nr:DUF4291 family protein [Micromonospora sp. A200]MDH6461918.1 hypothetical protein [Micromonospora sp. A200]
MQVPQRQIRARFTDTMLTVYQAYPPDIAAAAGRHDRRDAELNSRVRR